MAIATAPGVVTPDRRQQVEAERAAVMAQIEGLETTFAEIVASSELVATDDEHDPEGHTIAFERQQVAALRRDARIRLAALDDAIERIDAGTDGACIRCGGPIRSERLAAVPEATHCIDCAAAGP